MNNDNKVSPEERRIMEDRLKDDTLVCIEKVRSCVDKIIEYGFTNEQFALNFADIINVQSCRF